MLYFRFLAEKYQFTKSHLGEQDWFNLLQFEIPNLVYVIPCEYNFQLDISYQKQKLFKVKPSEIVIAHLQNLVMISMHIIPNINNCYPIF